MTDNTKGGSALKTLTAIKFHLRKGNPDEAMSALVEFEQAAYERERQSVLNEQKCKDCGCSYERCCCSPVREVKAFEQGFLACREKAAAVCQEDIDAPRICSEANDHHDNRWCPECETTWDEAKVLKQEIEKLTPDGGSEK